MYTYIYIYIHTHTYQITFICSLVLFTMSPTQPIDQTAGKPASPTVSQSSGHGYGLTASHA